MSFQFRSVANCCGMYEVSGFYGYNKDLQARLTKELKEKAQYPGTPVNCIAVLNEVQNKAWEQALTEIGFRVMRRHVFNPVHGNFLVLWIFEPEYDKSLDNPDFDHEKYEVRENASKGRKVYLKETGNTMSRF